MIFEHHLYVQTPTHTGKIITGLVETAKKINPTSMFSSVSYASYRGCTNLYEYLLKEIPTIKYVEKKWLLSLDSGITEPNAIRFLASLPNSFVHLYDAEYLLENNLKPRRKFHSKVYFFESYTPLSLGIFSGSANLTISGLFLNTEQSIASIFQGEQDDLEEIHVSEILKQKALLEAIFVDSSPVSDELIERYTSLYETKKEKVQNEDDRKLPQNISTDNPEFAIDKAAAIANASNFWVEIRYVVQNLGSGNPGNQIDLQRGSRVFFGFDIRKVERNTTLGSVVIRYNNHDTECVMRFGDNGMDKMNLPIPGQSGPSQYNNRILLFSRLEDNLFEMTTYSLDDIDRFVKLSENHNTSFSLRSKRRYGVY